MAPVKMVTNFISKKAQLGKNVKVWHFAYVGDDTTLGDNVMIGALAHIDSNVKIGDNSRIQGSAYLPTLTRIGKSVFVGPGVVFTNDPYPPCEKMIGVTVKDNAVIGARASIKAGVTIGKNSVVGMGSIVTRDVPDDTVVMGVPATIRYTREEYEQKQRQWKES